MSSPLDLTPNLHGIFPSSVGTFVPPPFLSSSLLHACFVSSAIPASSRVPPSSFIMGSVMGSSFLQFVASLATNTDSRHFLLDHDDLPERACTNNKSLPSATAASQPFDFVSPPLALAFPQVVVSCYGSIEPFQL